MFELSDRLVGIYKVCCFVLPIPTLSSLFLKVHDCTRHVVVEPKGILEKARPLKAVVDRVTGVASEEKVRLSFRFFSYMDFMHFSDIKGCSAPN